MEIYHHNCTDWASIFLNYFRPPLFWKIYLKVMTFLTMMSSSGLLLSHKETAVATLHRGFQSMKGCQSPLHPIKLMFPTLTTQHIWGGPVPLWTPMFSHQDCGMEFRHFAKNQDLLWKWHIWGREMAARKMEITQFNVSFFSVQTTCNYNSF